MGEARKRGSRAERVAQAREKLTPTPLAEVKAQLGLPESAEFSGYVVHLPKSDEFLAQATESAGATARTWAKTPDLARRYEDYHEARQVADACGDRAVVALLFDAGDRYAVAVP